MTPLLEADNLHRDYLLRRAPWQRAETVQALAGVSFELRAAHTLGVVGESGCGKSTLARLLALIEPPSAGRVRLDGEPIALDDARALRRARPRVQMVFQNPYASLNPRQRVGDALAEPLRLCGRGSAAERRDAACAMLQRVGLDAAHAMRFPHMFSGGQRQRIAIARALMLHPALVVADEPASALDVSVRAQVLNLLQELGEAFGVAYVFISHDLDVVRHVADELLVMYLGRCVESGAARQVLDAPLHPYTRALVAATPRLHRSTARVVLAGEPPSPLHPPPACAFHPRCPHAQARCRAERPVLRLVGEQWVACHRADEIARGVLG